MIWLACTGTVRPPGKEPICRYRLCEASNWQSILSNASGKTVFCSPEGPFRRALPPWILSCLMAIKKSSSVVGLSQSLLEILPHFMIRMSDERYIMQCPPRIDGDDLYPNQ